MQVPNMLKRKSNISHVDSYKAFLDVLSSTDKVIVDFYSDNCGPCRQIKPKLDDMSVQIPNIKFIKVNIDIVPDLADRMGIYGVPTFHFYNKGVLEKTVVGADLKKVKEAVEALQG